jgi:hypothetical protein
MMKQQAKRTRVVDETVVECLATGDKGGWIQGRDILIIMRYEEMKKFILILYVKLFSLTR